jgi:hypothetical protein
MRTTLPARRKVELLIVLLVFANLAVWGARDVWQWS